METARRAEVIVARLLEADPDEVDPKAMLKRLPGNYWIVSFDGVLDAEGAVEPALDYPVLAGTQEHAADTAKYALLQAGFNFDNALFIDAWIAEKSDWDDLKKVWDDITQDAIYRGKYGPKR